MESYVRVFTTNAWFNNVYHRVGIAFFYKGNSKEFLVARDIIPLIKDELERSYNCLISDKCVVECDASDYISARLHIDIYHSSYKF